jgi:hypothetical protein
LDFNDDECRYVYGFRTKEVERAHRHICLRLLAWEVSRALIFQIPRLDESK